MYYGVLHNIEEQLSEKGYTLGNRSELGEMLHYGINLCYVHGILSETERNRAYKRLNTWIGKNAVPINKDGEQE